MKEYLKRDGTDGVSTIRVFADADGAQIDVTVQRIGTTRIPLSTQVAHEIAAALNKAGEA